MRRYGNPSFSNFQTFTVTPAEAGVHFSAPKTVFKVVRCFACPGKTVAWVPAFAGTTMEVSF
jgi:hypothetical protein